MGLLDPWALELLVAAFAGGAFGYSLTGAAPRRLLDVSPSEQGIRLDAVDAAGDASTDGGQSRLAVEPWLPYQYRWSHVAAHGLVVGALGALLAYATGRAFLGFGISLVPLALLSLGVDRAPVTHHVTLPASTGVLAIAGATGGFVDPRTIAAAVPLVEAIALGAAFGLVGALLGEFAQRVFYAHADTHLDPPAASIVVTSVLIATLGAVGLLPGSAWIPLG